MPRQVPNHGARDAPKALSPGSGAPASSCSWGAFFAAAAGRGLRGAPGRTSAPVTPAPPSPRSRPGSRSRPASSSAIDGQLIAEIGFERRTPVSIHALPAYVPQAVVAIEDKRFYKHHGFDPRGIARAAFGVLTGRNLGGGSTITQQLARNMFDGRSASSGASPAS